MACCKSAGLVHNNERQWRTFRHRVGQVLAAQDGIQAKTAETIRAEGQAASANTEARSTKVYTTTPNPPDSSRS
jgi:hypothetical protein